MIDLPQTAPIPTRRPDPAQIAQAFAARPPAPVVGQRPRPSQENQIPVSGMSLIQPQQQAPVSGFGGLAGLGGMPAPTDGGRVSGMDRFFDIVQGVGLAIDSPQALPGFVDNVLQKREAKAVAARTVSMLDRKAPDLAEAVRSGMMQPRDAFGEYLNREKQAREQEAFQGYVSGFPGWNQSGQDSGSEAGGGGMEWDRDNLLGLRGTYAQRKAMARNERERAAADALLSQVDELLDNVPDASPMTSPEERARWGIPADDTRPYKLTSQGPVLIGGSGVTVENNIAGERAWDTESAKLFAKRYDDISAGAMKASEMLGMYDLAEQALASGVRTGLGAEAELNARRLAEAMGLEADPQKVAGGELIRAIQNRMALTMRSPDGGMGMPGALSDRDIQFLKASQIGIDRTPEGNRAMLDAFRRMENRKIEVARLADQYIEENGQLDPGFYGRVRQYAEENPLFADMGQNRPQPDNPGPSRVRNPAPSRPRATNPATGEVIEWNGQEWAPVQ